MLMVIWGVIFILYIHHFRTRKFQIRSGTITQTFPLQLQQKTNRWKCTMLYPFQQIEHYRSSRRTSISEWIIRTHMAYPDTNDESIHHIKSSCKGILVLHVPSCINYDQPSSGPFGLKLTTPFELVHNTKPNSKTWFQLFSI